MRQLAPPARELVLHPGRHGSDDAPADDLQLLEVLEPVAQGARVAAADEGGQLVTATLMDYAMPKAAMFPEIELATTCTPTDLNPLGAKGIGELGTIGATPCLMSAAKAGISEGVTVK